MTYPNFKWLNPQKNITRYSIASMDIRDGLDSIVVV
jgi:hypothetical protein